METSVIGLITIRNSENPDRVASTIQSIGDNYFNVVFGESHLNNRGFMLIPFAKNWRAGDEDPGFLELKLRELIAYFNWIAVVVVEAHMDASYSGRMYYQLVSTTGNLTVDKFRYQLHSIL